MKVRASLNLWSHGILSSPKMESWRTKAGVLSQLEVSGRLKQSFTGGARVLGDEGPRGWKTVPSS